MNRTSPRRALAAAVAIAIVSALLATLIPTAGLPSASGPHPVTAQLVDPNAPVSGALKSEVVAQAQETADTLGIPVAVAAPEIAKIANESPSEILSGAGLSSSALTPFDSCGPLGGSCGSNAGVALGGCAVGAALGAAGAGVGAGVGCVVGAAAGLLIFQFGISQGNSGADVLKAYSSWANAMISTVANEYNLTTTAYQNLLSALNFSEIAFQRMADNAALLQLGNLSFNVPLVEIQSGIAAQMGTIIETFAAQATKILTDAETWASAQLTATGPYASVTPSFGGQPVNGQSPGPAYSGSDVGTGTSSWNISNVQVPLGTAYLICLGCATLSYRTEWSTAWHSAVSTTVETGSPDGTVYSYAPAGGGDWNGTWYQFSTSSSFGSWLIVPGGSLVATTSSTSATGWTAATVNAQGFLTGSGGYIGYVTQEVGSSSTVGFSGSGYSSYQAHTDPGGFAASLGPWLGAIEFQAAENGEAYWSFLHTIGYTSVSQIPPDCLVPAPYQVLPADLNLGNLTEAQLQSLYLAWLNGMGTFYNVTLSGTQFCGTQATHQFNLGNNATWGNLFVNATGYVYLNNGTSPIGINGKLLSTESYSNASTWAIANDQILLMPTLASVSIPVGVKWAVPRGDPIQIYVIQPGVMLRLAGNGTTLSTAIRVATASPGDSIYLTSCTIAGTATSNCTVLVQTINTTVANLSCGLGGAPGTPGSCASAPGGTFGGFPNPFSWLANALSSLFGGGALGSFLGGLFAALIILGVIAVLAYVAVVEVAAWGRKKRGGGAVGARR